MSEEAEIDEILKEFLAESRDGLDRFDADLVALEENPSDREKLSCIFRTVHTIKGTCGLLGFAELQSLSNAGESVLGRLRDGRLKLNSEIVNALLAMADLMRRMLEHIDATGQEGEEKTDSVVSALAELESTRKDSVVLREIPACIIDTPTQVGMQAIDGSPRLSSENRVHVDVATLDKLLNLVGELVLVRNQIAQSCAQPGNAARFPAAQRLSTITTELQENLLKARMQPISIVWNRFHRTVRDLALTCGKLVRFETQGDDTELDRSILEAICDPLTHIVRNSIDHGFENPEARIACGKPREGRFCMHAFHRDGQVNIEISDDGAGIDLERLKRKALERGLLTGEQAARLNEREILNLVFLPGFSTAEKVTELSGRGVGMDVVKSNIEKIGGVVEIQSALGRGTKVKIRIPLTLTIIPALIVSCGAGRYAVPQVNVVELLRLEGNEPGRCIEMIHAMPVLRLRGRLLPIVNLHEALDLERTQEEVREVARNVLVLKADKTQFGLVVDDIGGFEEIVVKPLAKELAGIPVFAGATIMGDGRVALILDAHGIARYATIASEMQSQSERAGLPNPAPDAPDRRPLLLFDLGDEGRIAVPLEAVSRLEHISKAAVERTGGHEVVQCRGGIMPLIHAADVLGRTAKPAMDPSETLSVVVFSDHERSMGLVVNRILDAVEDTIRLQRGPTRRGMLGSAVIQGKVTELLDMDEFVRAADHYFDSGPSIT